MGSSKKNKKNTDEEEEKKKMNKMKRRVCSYEWLAGLQTRITHWEIKDGAGGTTTRRKDDEEETRDKRTQVRTDNHNNALGRSVILPTRPGLRLPPLPFPIFPSSSFRPAYKVLRDPDRRAEYDANGKI